MNLFCSRADLELYFLLLEGEFKENLIAPYDTIPFLRGNGRCIRNILISSFYKDSYSLASPLRGIAFSCPLDIASEK